MTSTRSTVRRFRLAMATLLAALVAVMALGAAAAPAQAVTSNQLSMFAGCDRYHHSAGFSSNVVLSDAFPQGTYVATRYAYTYLSKTTLQPISSAYITAWKVQFVGPSTTYVGELIISNQGSSLPPYTFSTSGYLRAQVQIGVWNGTSYNYSPWVSPSGYTNVDGQYSQYRSTNSVCTAY